MQNFKIEIVSEDVQVLKGTSRKTGNPYEMHMQTCYLHSPGQPHPDRYEINLRGEVKKINGEDVEVFTPFPKGFYEPSEKFIGVFNGSITVRPLEIVPVKENKKQQAA